MKTKGYRAAAKGIGCSASTARKAAVKFFEEFPGRRKCDVIEGEIDGEFFVIRYGEPWPRSFKGVTPKTASTLPDIEGDENE